jgi:hypothetical protein
MHRPIANLAAVPAGLVSGALLAAIIVVGVSVVPRAFPQVAALHPATACRMVTIGGPTFKLGCDSTARCGGKVFCVRFAEDTR